VAGSWEVERIGKSSRGPCYTVLLQWHLFVVPRGATIVVSHVLGCSDIILLTV
jgi:hypothetical protein